MKHQVFNKTVLYQKIGFSMIAAALLGLSFCANALAQKPPAVGDFPNRPIRFIIGFPPGGISDTIARIFSTRLGQELGQTVFVDSRPGAGGVIGMGITVNSAPDGYTWYLAQPVMNICRFFKTNKPSYDPLQALAPVTLLGTSPTVLVTYPSFPVKTIKELISYAKAQNKPLHFGSSGVGTTNHFAGVLLSVMANIPLEHVSYKGAPENTRAVMGGEIPLAVQPLTAALPHLQSGRLRGIAVTGNKRSRTLPDLPTIAETIPGYRVEAWYGIVVPAKTPQPIIDHVSNMVNKVLNIPEIAVTLLKQGLEVDASTPAEFGKFLHEDVQRWEKLIKQSGIELN